MSDICEINFCDSDIYDSTRENINNQILYLESELQDLGTGGDINNILQNIKDMTYGSYKDSIDIIMRIIEKQKEYINYMENVMLQYDL